MSIMASDVAYQGIEGSYSEEAVKRLGFVPVPCDTFKLCVDLVEDDTVKYALLPIENSTEGSVGETNDILLRTNLVISREIKMPINHCLIGYGSMEKLKTAYSHMQALGQCREFLNMHNISSIPTFDTAGAVQMISKLDDDSKGAIASRTAAEVYNVPVIESNINDSSKNYTRFVLLCKQSMIEPEAWKTTVRFNLPNSPGRLHKVLSIMKNVNLTRIESRPIKNGDWSYAFLIDFMSDMDDKRTKSMLNDLKKATSNLHILGTYREA